MYGFPKMQIPDLCGSLISLIYLNFCSKDFTVRFPIIYIISPAYNILLFQNDNDNEQLSVG